MSGKFSSTIRNLIEATIAFFLAHLCYRMYIVTIQIEESNTLIRSVYEIMRALAKKYRIQIP